MPESVCAKGNCKHFLSLQQNTAGTNQLGRYDFLLIFQSDLRHRLNNCPVISQLSQQNQSPRIRTRTKPWSIQWTPYVMWHSYCIYYLKRGNIVLINIIFKRQPTVFILWNVHWAIDVNTSFLLHKGTLFIYSLVRIFSFSLQATYKQWTMSQCRTNVTILFSCKIKYKIQQAYQI